MHGGGAYSFAARLNHVAIDHASLSRGSIVPTTIDSRDTSSMG